MVRLINYILSYFTPVFFDEREGQKYYFKRKIGSKGFHLMKSLNGNIYEVGVVTETKVNLFGAVIDIEKITTL